MENIEDKNDLLFRLLCADALRSKGVGFPETDCDIDAFCREYVPNDDEKKCFEEIKDDIIENTITATFDSEGKPECGVLSPPRNIIDFEAHRKAPDYRMASGFRKPEDSEISKELDDEINRIIDEEDSQEGSIDE